MSPKEWLAVDNDTDVFEYVTNDHFNNQINKSMHSRIV